MKPPWRIGVLPRAWGRARGICGPPPGGASAQEMEVALTPSMMQTATLREAGMQQRDYILRLIEQIGAALIALRNRILGRKVDPLRIREELTGLAGQAGYDLALLRGFSGETLHMLVSPTGEVEPGSCWLIAELLYLDGLQAQVEERTGDAREGLQKARLLFRLIEPGGGMLVGLPEAGERIDDIDMRLEALGGSQPSRN
jgi:hypothetical protein